MIQKAMDDLKIKEDLINLIVTSPFTGRAVQLRFLEKEMYVHFFNRMPELFDIQEPVEEKPKKKGKRTDEEVMDNYDYEVGLPENE